MKFTVTEPNGKQAEINGTYHTLTYAETMGQLDRFQVNVPCFVENKRLLWEVMGYSKTLKAVS